MKKINLSSGFTIIELLTSFTLATVVLVFLFNIVLLLKDNYIQNSIKSNLIIEQSLLSAEINNDFVVDGIINIQKCTGTFCYNISLDNEGVPLTKKLEVDTIGKTVKYGNYTYNIGSTEELGTPTICKKITTASKNMNSYLIIDIPITSTVIESTNNNFGIKVVYPYYPSNITIDSSVNNCLE